MVTNLNLNLKQVIKSLLSMSSRKVRRDGAIEHRFTGNVNSEIAETIRVAYREGHLSQSEGFYFASKDHRHVSFKFGSGASTTNYLWFSYVDERTV